MDFEEEALARMRERLAHDPDGLILVKAAQAVLHLHAPVRFQNGMVCAVDQQWPCETRRVIRAALCDMRDLTTTTPEIQLPGWVEQASGPGAPGTPPSPPGY
jgi:hypothetical protein